MSCLSRRRFPALLALPPAAPRRDLTLDQLIEIAKRTPCHALCIRASQGGIHASGGSPSRETANPGHASRPGSAMEGRYDAGWDVAPDGKRRIPSGKRLRSNTIGSLHFCRYAVTADGQRFLTAGFQVVLNWTAGVKK